MHRTGFAIILASSIFKYVLSDAPTPVRESIGLVVHRSEVVAPLL